MVYQNPNRSDLVRLPRGQGQFLAEALKCNYKRATYQSG
jgi:hypothetical protein